MRSEELYLRDIVEAAEAVTRFIGDQTWDEFKENEVVGSAVLLKLLNIGEAARNISNSMRESYPEVPWSDVVGFRNLLIHHYFVVMWQIVWETAISDLPALKSQVEEILETQFGS